MANVKVKNADGSNIWMKATGAGSDGDPNVVEHLETNSAAIKTAVETMAGAVDTEVQVDVVGALPTGDNNIGNVDIVTLPADPLGANADAAATAGSTGSLSAKLRLVTSQLDAIKTAVETLDNVVSGNAAQVDVVGALPAGTNLLGRISASPETSTVYNGTSALTPKFAAINVASSGNNTILAAVTDKKIRVLQVMLMAGGTVNVRFESGADGTALSGIMELTAQTGFVLPYSPVGWFETAASTLLNLELSGAVNVDGLFVYVEV